MKASNRMKAMVLKFRKELRGSAQKTATNVFLRVYQSSLDNEYPSDVAYSHAEEAVVSELSYLLKKNK